MTYFIYVVLAIAFIVALFVIFGMFTDRGKDTGASTPQHNTPQEEQQHEPKGHTGEKKADKD